jgi:hypothetical protein
MSLKVAIGKSQKGDIAEAAQEAARSCRAQIDIAEVTLALLFGTPAFATQSLPKNILSALGAEVPLIGCSAMGLITPEGTQNEGLILVLAASPSLKASCGEVTLDNPKDAFLSGQELGSHLISGVTGYRRDICLLLSDGLSEKTSGVIQGLQNVLGRSFPFIGAGASDNFAFKQTAQFYNGTLLHKSAVAALLSGKLSYALGIRHGWKPLGKIHTITRSYANVIQSIDGKRAGLLYEDYFAKSLPELKKEILRINILYPIGISLEGENEYLLRNIISLNDDGSIITQGDVPQGSSIRIMIGTKESALSAARQAAEQVKASLRDKELSLAIVMSSASRARLLGRDIDEEFKVIRKTLGKDVPLAGFYSYGEYAPLGSTAYYGQTYLHNQTIAILGIGE